MMHAQVATLLQPHTLDCSKPEHDQPHRAGDHDGAAVVELLRLAARSSGHEIQVRISAMIATGMLIQKIDRHVHWVRNPPAIGPIAVSPPEMPKKIAIALPRSRSGNEATTIATAAGNSSAAVAPWSDPEEDDPGLRRSRPSG